MLNKEDPRLAAFALGELEEPERSAVEREVAASAELQQEVREIRQLAQTLSADLAEELRAPAETGSGVQTQVAAPATKPAHRIFRLRRILAIAATVLIGGMLVSVFLVTGKSCSRGGSATVEVSSVREAADAQYTRAQDSPDLRRPGQKYDARDLKKDREGYGEKSPAPAAGGPAPGHGPMGPGNTPGEPAKTTAPPPPPGPMTIVAPSPLPVGVPTPLGDESYEHVLANAYKLAQQEPLSTFAIDVDTASYANVRRLLTSGQLPPAGAVRIEEMVNYFKYDYPSPGLEHPFSVSLAASNCPWQKGHYLVRIGLKGREIAAEKRPPCNLVFLLDVSGSMADANKLPLVKQAMKLVVEQVSEDDRVAIVTYAGSSGVALPPTNGSRKDRILDALDRLQAGGSTNGAGGITQAYEVAGESFIKGGVNRVILCTDGDFNVGVTAKDKLVELIQDKAKSGVFLSVFGFGMGNLKDSTLEKLADKGHGNYGYIDSIKEAQKSFVEQFAGTMITIAKDVKIQVEFNPAKVEAYRLIGYENRVMPKEDFNDDKKDGGDIGAGHVVTAIYQVVPVGADVGVPGVDPLKYQHSTTLTAEARESNELMTIKLRYKDPDGKTSKLLSVPVKDEVGRFSQSGNDFQFACSVAAFAMILRDSPYKGQATLESVLETAAAAKGTDKDGYRAEFVELVKKAIELKKGRS